MEQQEQGYKKNKKLVTQTKSETGNEWSNEVVRARDKSKESQITEVTATKRQVKAVDMMDYWRQNGRKGYVDTECPSRKTKKDSEVSLTIRSRFDSNTGLEKPAHRREIQAASA